jgi:hypothetical protein
MWCSKTHRTPPARWVVGNLEIDRPAAGVAYDGTRVLEELGVDAITPAILIP